MPKQIQLLITTNTSLEDLISSYHNLLPEQYQVNAEYGVVNAQVLRCIEDYVDRLQSLAQSGTTINISKEFTLGDLTILILLQYPERKNGFLNKIKRLLIN